MKGSIDVALILWNTDVIDLVSFVLLRRNLRSDGIEPSHGSETVLDFVKSSSPAVIVYDLEPPYGRSSANVLSLIDRLPDCAFVMTCADRARVLKIAPWLSSHALFQKPYLMDDIAETVESMVIGLKKIEGDVSFPGPDHPPECLPAYVARVLTSRARGDK